MAHTQSVDNSTYIADRHTAPLLNHPPPPLIHTYRQSHTQSRQVRPPTRHHGPEELVHGRQVVFVVCSKSAHATRALHSDDLATDVLQVGRARGGWEWGGRFVCVSTYGTRHSSVASAATPVQWAYAIYAAFTGPPSLHKHETTEE